MHTPTKLASILSSLSNQDISAIEINFKLCSLGFQIRNEEGYWKLTAVGEAFGSYYASIDSEGYAYQAIHWDPYIITNLKKNRWICPDRPVSKAVWRASIKPYPERRAMYALKFSITKKFSVAA